MIKTTCLIIVALCLFSQGKAKSQEDTKLMEHEFKLKQLLENSDAIIMGYLEDKHNDFMGTHYLIKDAVFLKGALHDNIPFIVITSSKWDTDSAAEFHAFGTFDDSLYLFFLKKSDRDDKSYKEMNRSGSPFRINGITYGPYGVIPLEKNALLIDYLLELGRLKNINQVDANFIRKIITKTTPARDVSNSNVERFIKFFRAEYKDRIDIDTEKLRRREQGTKKVNESLKAIKSLYDIDVPAQKDTFIAALRLLINDQEPDEETPQDVREMVKKLKSVNWSEPEKPQEQFEKSDKPEDQNEPDIIFE